MTDALEVEVEVADAMTNQEEIDALALEAKEDLPNLEVVKDAHLVLEAEVIDVLVIEGLVVQDLIETLVTEEKDVLMILKEIDDQSLVILGRIDQDVLEDVIKQ
jgi:hypothetical protein